MQKAGYRYLIKLQFLGFRYSGWQYQPHHKTIEGMILKTMAFILPNQPFKILGAGRTDAKVSALDAAFVLYKEIAAIAHLQTFLNDFNNNLPSDIRALDIQEVDENFNIIKNGKVKEYVYLFSFGKKNHPYCAPFMANFMSDLNLDKMRGACRLFVGRHDFKVYTAQIGEKTKTVRTLIDCDIKPNTLLTANFFPENSYGLHITGEGFMRYQIRMIMGALVQVGQGILSFSDIENSLSAEIQKPPVLDYIAPGSGLHLLRLEFGKHIMY